MSGLAVSLDRLAELADERVNARDEIHAGLAALGPSRPSLTTEDGRYAARMARRDATPDERAARARRLAMVRGKRALVRQPNQHKPRL